MQVLEVDQLQKTYRSGGKTVEAVRNVSFGIESHEVLAFLGANGAGKTTTIKMIAGLVLPDRGQVKIAGRDPHQQSIALKSVGAVLEGNRNVYWRLTPEENLEYFGVLRGLSGYVARQRAKVLLERFELMHKRSTIVQNLSRGMQQKLAIAVALIHEPQLLLLDEPTLGLDIEATQTVKRLVREIAGEGRAILLTTHQLDIAEELSNRVAIIKQGEIVAQERTETLIQKFSGDSYRIELEQELDPDRRSKLAAIDTVIEGKTIYIRQIDLLYQGLEILKPSAIVRIEKDQANLADVFLKLVKK